MSFYLQRIAFDSHGSQCIGDLYLPNEVIRPPILIMAHGFATQRTYGLAPFAERFVQQGIAVVTFDYRGFGESEGQPRLVVHPKKQIEDLESVIAYVRSHHNLDGHRLALWGSSYGAGHVIVVAARTPGICAIIAQVPHVDAISTIRKLGIVYTIVAFGHILRDALASLLGRQHVIKVVAKPGEFAVMNTAECEPGFRSIVPDVDQWENRCAGRSLLLFIPYRPVVYARQIKCPALVIGAKYDSLIEIQSVERAAARIEKGQYLQMPIRHFDIYTGAGFAGAIDAQVEFLRENLFFDESRG